LQEFLKIREPLVSVKMITYNHAPFIAQAIEGVIQQKTIFPFELIIGEDCSTDGTREIVLKYQKKYPDIIQVITSENNVGVVKNSYRTRKACRGKYVAFCEGDDYWHNTDKLQKQVDYLENNPKCGLVYSSYNVYHPGSQEKIDDFINYNNWEIPELPGIYDFLEGKFELGLSILTCTVMVRRNLYEKIIEADPFLHQSGHFLMGDTQLWAEMSTMADLHYVPESLATHVITDESATRSKDLKKKLRFRISVTELMIYLCNKYNHPTAVRNEYEATWSNLSLRLAFYSRDGELADEVRRRKKTFTWKEWVRYHAAKNSLVHLFYRAISSFFSLFRKERSEWR
jgi:glycosyltransferase involved in cell wall biosynthesis